MAPEMRPRFTHQEILEATEVHHAIEREVRFQDVDAARTIFFARILEYASDAYVGLLGARGLDLPGVLREGLWAAPYAHVEADFRAPLFYGDLMRIEVVATSAGESSYALGYRVVSPTEPTKVYALIQSVHVVIDTGSFKPRGLPEALRRALTRPA